VRIGGLDEFQISVSPFSHGFREVGVHDRPSRKEKWMNTRLAASLRIALFGLLATPAFFGLAHAQPPAGPTADDIADVAGILVYDRSSLTGMLHVLPGEGPKVLEVLSAYPIGPLEDHKYKVNAGGPPVIVGIAPDLDWTLGEDLVNPDDDQVWIFKNRMCTETAPLQAHFCQPNGSGQYTTLFQLPNRVCRRNNFSMGSYCYENYRKNWSTLQVWKDEQCTILDHQETKEKYTCGN
jgi:hypothetical protein